MERWWRIRIVSLAAVALLGLGCEDDRDLDGQADARDNCIDAPNANQVDRDGDGLGDACDDDAILRLLLVKVQTPDGVVSQSDAQIAATLADVDAYYREVSYGNLRLAGITHPEQAGDIVGPVPVTTAYDGYNDHEILFPVADALPGMGVNAGLYDEIVFVVPDTFGNRAPAGFASGYAAGGYIWLRAVAMDRPGPIGHEIGHNLEPGLGHANLFQCSGPPPYDLAYTGCVSFEYLDPFDAMGWSELRGHMSASKREWAGFFSAGNVLEVTQSGQYLLTPIEKPGPEVKTVKIRRGPSEYIYLEYRQPIGYDAISVGTLAGSADGVQIRSTFHGPGGSVLLQPSGTFSLAPGQSYDAGSFRVTTLRTLPEVTLFEVVFD